MDADTAQRILRDALRQLIIENYELCINGVNERSVTSQLFRYLASHPMIPLGLNVDHEYNRMGEYYVKKLRVQLKTPVETDALGDPEDINAIPDILIHSRGDHESNLVAIEVKVDSDADARDIAKIRALRQSPFAYEHGVLLVIRVDTGEAGPRWTPIWAWNPPVDQEITYGSVFTESEARELFDQARQHTARRRQSAANG